MGTIKVKPINHMVLQTSAIPTNDTHKNRGLIFSAHQPSESIFEQAENSADYERTIRKEKKFPVTSAFTESILIELRDAKDVGMKKNTGKLHQALDMTELEDLTITQDADLEEL